jgi:ABC-type transport system involved in cytochrome c biogenesis permease subunit
VGGACLALTAALVRRGLQSGHWPLASRYEFALSFVWAVLAVYLLLEISWRDHRAGGFVLVFALLVATYAVTRPPGQRTMAPLLPALRSVWLQLHVLTALVGYGAFGVAAGLGVMRLTAGDGGGRWPAADEIERQMARAVGLGFPWLTLGILTGAVWAQRAWGRYWAWDPKETWALITWLGYLIWMHLYPLRRWRGRRAALLAVVDFGLVLFTFIGVPWFVQTTRLESLHGF